MSNEYLPLPDPTVVDPRYTTVALVKQAVGIDNTATDDQITQAIVALEYMLDARLGTSFPQDPDPNAGTDDALDPAPIEVVPVAIQQASLQGSIAVLKLLDTPFGVGGGDFIGELAAPWQTGVSGAVNDVMPLLLSFHRSWGIS